MKNNGKLPPERFSIQYCNVNKEELRIELYIIQPGEKISRCEENPEMPIKTVLFESVRFDSPKVNLVPVESSYIDVVGPSEGEYSEVALTRLKQLLNNFPQSKVYLFAYLQTNFETDENGKIIEKPKNADKKSLAAKMLQTAEKELIVKGFNAAQIQTIDGGYVQNERRLEFWLVPPGGEIPKPKPDYFPKKKVKK